MIVLLRFRGLAQTWVTLGTLASDSLRGRDSLGVWQRRLLCFQETLDIGEQRVQVPPHPADDQRRHQLEDTSRLQFHDPAKVGASRNGIKGLDTLDIYGAF